MKPNTTNHQLQNLKASPFDNHILIGRGDSASSGEASIISCPLNAGERSEQEDKMKAKKVFGAETLNALLVKNGYDKHEHVARGIRMDDKLFVLGETVPNSRIWVDGEPTDQYLDGVSVIGYPITTDGLYVYDHAYLVEGDAREFGEDDGELILRNARVIAILDTDKDA